MKVLLTSVGSRGDVQPLLALALELRALGHTPSVCVAPNFQTWVESFGIKTVLLGEDIEKWTRAGIDVQQVKKIPARARQRENARHNVSTQFRVLSEAARDCDLILAGGLMQTAGRSVAELLKIPYVYASFCPATLPTPDHPPAKMGFRFSQSLPSLANRLLWSLNERAFNWTFREVVNEQRAEIGLTPIKSILRFIATDSPWLATDPVLGPVPAPIGMQITQTGAWLMSDPAALPEEVEKFLAEGEPPIYFGFGSMPAAGQTSQVLVKAARAVGRRAIISQGWGGLDVVDDGSDCIAIGPVSHQQLFPRVAAVVHHGGAGTTTTVARAGAPQLIVPHIYDQYYWAHRVQQLGVGVAGMSPARLNVDELAGALRACLRPEVVARAQKLAERVEPHGARIAAQRLHESFA